MSRFDALDETDKTYLIQYWRTVDRMAAWENYLVERNMERSRKRK